MEAATINGATDLPTSKDGVLSLTEYAANPSAEDASKKEAWKQIDEEHRLPDGSPDVIALYHSMLKQLMTIRQVSGLDPLFLCLRRREFHPSHSCS